MKFNYRIVLYFGWAGVAASIFFTFLKLLKNDFEGEFLSICGNFFLNALLGYAYTVIVSYAILLTLRKINRVLPWQKNALARFSANLLITPIVAMVAIFPLAIVSYSLGFNFGHPTLKAHLINQEVTALVLDLILVGVYESYFLLQLWKKSLIKNEQLEKENIVARYEALKNQVNPHFLFNSLNTVSSLIHQDPEKAEEFIDEFSKIYRFLLEHQKQEVHSLKCELEFVNSYLSLQKIRFEDQFKCHISISESKLERMIPTLSIQLLVENAIKHNLITVKDPLTIEILEEDDCITVKNNLQLRKESLDSTGIGLNNLNARYAILTHKAPIYDHSDSHFTAKIPLLAHDEN